MITELNTNFRENKSDVAASESVSLKIFPKNNREDTDNVSEKYSLVTNIKPPNGSGSVCKTEEAI